MRMSRVPFFSWSALVAAIGLLLMLPVLVGVLIYLFIDHQHARALFGGNVGIGSWIGFALTQPATYLFALPAVGITAELIPVTFRQRMPMRGITYAGIALVGVAALSGVTQQAFHDLPWNGSAGDNFDDLLPYAIFTLLPLLGVLIVMVMGLFTVRTFNWSGDTRPNISASFLFAFFGLGMILVGMLAGALYPIADLGLQGTVFEEAALVYVAYGAALCALGAIAWWLPKWSGRTLPAGPAMGLALLGVVATVLASLPYVIAGFADQPAASGDLRLQRAVGAVERAGHHRPPADAPDGARVRRPRAAPDAPTPTPSATIRGRPRRWSGPPPRRRPIDNFTEVPTVMSPEPALDRRGPDGADR